MSVLDSGSPCVYRPRLAIALGQITDAVVLQQIHYWLGKSENIDDGYTWVWKSRRELAAELGLSERQVRSSLDRLRSAGLLKDQPSPRNRWNRTLWWRIDYEALDHLIPDEPDPTDAMALAVRYEAGRADAHDQSWGPERPTIGPRRPSNNRDYVQESTTTTTTEIVTADVPDWSETRSERSLALARLERFVDASIEAGLGKGEYRDDDLAKPDWLAAFQSLECSDDAFDQALEAAFADRDSAWQKRLRGRRAAQAFVGRFNAFAPPRHPAYGFPSILEPAS